MIKRHTTLALPILSPKSAIVHKNKQIHRVCSFVSPSPLFPPFLQMCIYICAEVDAQYIQNQKQNPRPKYNCVNMIIHRSNESKAGSSVGRILHYSPFTWFQVCIILNVTSSIILRHQFTPLAPESLPTQQSSTSPGE